MFRAPSRDRSPVGVSRRDSGSLLHVARSNSRVTTHALPSPSPSPSLAPPHKRSNVSWYHTTHHTPRTTRRKVVVLVSVDSVLMCTCTSYRMYCCYRPRLLCTVYVHPPCLRVLDPARLPGLCVRPTLPRRPTPFPNQSSCWARRSGLETGAAPRTPLKLG